MPKEKIVTGSQITPSGPSLSQYGPVVTSLSPTISPEELREPGATKLVLGQLKELCSQVNSLRAQLESKEKELKQRSERIKSLEVQNAILQERIGQNFGNMVITIVIGALLGLIPTLHQIGWWMTVVIAVVCILLGFSLWTRVSKRSL